MPDRASRLQGLRQQVARVFIWSSTPKGLVALFALGLAIRLWLARGGGFPGDVQLFRSWAGVLATTGARDFYHFNNNEFYADYPPVYLYVLLLLGKLSKWLWGIAPTVFLIKLPPILADLGLAFVVMKLTKRLTFQSDADSGSLPTLAATTILLNPAVIFLSAVWGQADSVTAFLVLSGFLVLVTRRSTLVREILGFSILTLALTTKPQAAFVIPIAVLLVAWRRFHGGSKIKGVAALVLTGLACVGIMLAVAVPFGLGPVKLFELYQFIASRYQYTSVMAYNFWGVGGFWRPDLPGGDDVYLFGLPAFYRGITIFAVGAVMLLIHAWRSLGRGQSQSRVLVFGGAALSCLAFAVLTRMHERYLFLGLACLAPLVFINRKLRLSFIVISTFYLANLYLVYVINVEYVGRQTFKIDFLYNLLYGHVWDSLQNRLFSLATGVLCLIVAWPGWRWIEGDSEEGAEPEREQKL